MNEALKMQISAFVDGELPANEAELLLRRLSRDAAMRRQVAEYMAIGRMIRGDRAVPGIERLRAGIAAELGNDQAAEPEADEVIGSRFMTPAAGIGVAAAVAVVALIGLNQFSATATDPLPGAVAIDTAPLYTEPSADVVLLNSPNERQLDYLRRHSDDDILYRMATFELSERHEEIEPDGHLVTTDEATEAAPSEAPQ